MWAGFWTDERKSLRAELNGFYGTQDEGGGWAMHLGPRVSWRPAANVDLSPAPSVFRQHDTWQYLETADALGQTHYLFGELNQTTAGMTVRSNVTFAPNLTLQLYAEPFIASGDYVGFKRVADPRAKHLDQEFDTFGPDRLIVSDGDVSVDLDRDGTADIDLGNPDFSFLSFRSNLVLRWEYAAGSSLFVVWQHGRSYSDENGQFRLGPSLGDLFSTAEARNTFLVKVSYWMSL